MFTCYLQIMYTSSGLSKIKRPYSGFGSIDVHRLKTIIAIFSTCLMSSSAFALAISSPINYLTPNLVGTAAPGTAASKIANELIWANQILALFAGTTTTILETTGSVDYRTHDTDEYSGVLTSIGAYQAGSGSTSIAAGAQYVLGKYAGKNAGYVLYFLGGAASTIPLLSNDIWVNRQNQGYQLSHYTAFGRTPPPTSLSEPGTLGLLGVGLFGWVVMRRFKRVV
jgi:hypothetical protein